MENLIKELTWNLGSLLLDFFQLYGVQFNYLHTGISLKNGGEYFQKRERSKGTQDWVNPSRPNLLAFENPCQPDVDMGRNSFMMFKVKRAFEHAYQLLCAALGNSKVESYLTFVIRSDDPILAKRSGPDASYPRTNAQFLKDAVDGDEVLNISTLTSTSSMSNSSSHHSTVSSSLTVPSSSMSPSSSTSAAAMGFETSGSQRRENDSRAVNDRVGESTIKRGRDEDGLEAENNSSGAGKRKK